MPAGIMFWVLMILWAIFGVFGSRPSQPGQPWNYFGLGGTLLEFVLFLLLGWKLFGAPLQ